MFLFVLVLSLFLFGCASNINFENVKKTMQETNSKGISSKESVPINTRDCNVEKVTCDNLCNTNSIENEKESCKSRCSDNYFACTRSN